MNRCGLPQQHPYRAALFHRSKVYLLELFSLRNKALLTLSFLTSSAQLECQALTLLLDMMKPPLAD